MTSDYVLSHFDAMALWDAVLGTEPEEMAMLYTARHDSDGTWSVATDGYSPYSGRLGHVWVRGLATRERAEEIADRVNETHGLLDSR